MVFQVFLSSHECFDFPFKSFHIVLKFVWGFHKFLNLFESIIIELKLILISKSRACSTLSRSLSFLATSSPCNFPSELSSKFWQSFTYGSYTLRGMIKQTTNRLVREQDPKGEMLQIMNIEATLNKI